MWTKEHVKELVEANRLIIFAKGTKDAPRCGFSARAMQVVGQFGKPFEVVDILSDPSIRPALVAHSEFPTSPQVFLNGELLGGSDIIFELSESGELERLIQSAFEGVAVTPAAPAPVTISAAALAQLSSFKEDPSEFLRVEVQQQAGGHTYGLALEKQSSPTVDRSWTIGGLKTVISRSCDDLYDKLSVDWVENPEHQGFSVQEVGTPPQPTELDTEELRGLLSSGAKLRIVDVREDDEWAAGHIDGALHLPLSRIETEWQQHAFEASETLIVYCAKGARSLRATQYLRADKGLPGARSLRGGIGAFPA
jgi:monothiol glutaredoxin